MRFNDLGEDRRSEYTDTVLRVSASRWAPAVVASQLDQFTLSVAPSAQPGMRRDNDSSPAGAAVSVSFTRPSHG